MRLNNHYIAIIKSQAKSIFGIDSDVFLFGSRTDDAKKGGDIDLFIKLTDKTNLFEKKVKFLARLKRNLGEQKIDVVFNEDSTRLIEKEISKCAIIL